jgi:lysophospholipase L1-like esterase
MRRPALLAAVPLIASLLVPVTGAAAAPPRQPTALVTLGDSYISGEAGRWNGNSANAIGSRTGTDRAWVRTTLGGYHSPALVYGDTHQGCDRSDVAPALSNDVRVDVKLNIACSGAKTANVIRGVNGGVGQHGELPQADQLAELARSHDVEVVVLSIGGNDLGFASIIQACLVAYTTLLSGCAATQQQAVDAVMPAALDGVRQAIDDVRAVLAAAGQRPNSYRFVLQSYPSPIPRGADNRYPERGVTRQAVGACPFSDADSDWARDSLVPQISAALAGVAAEKGLQLLDLSDAFSGREACAAASSQPLRAPSGEHTEWMRFVTLGATQGILQESLHPNAYGQQAMGRCYTLLVAAPARHDMRCLNTPGVGPEGMRLVRSR